VWLGGGAWRARCEEWMGLLGESVWGLEWLGFGKVRRDLVVVVVMADGELRTLGREREICFSYFCFLGNRPIYCIFLNRDPGFRHACLLFRCTSSLLHLSN
jgi:hypothetical protein